LKLPSITSPLPNSSLEWVDLLVNTNASHKHLVFMFNPLTGIILLLAHWCLSHMIQHKKKKQSKSWGKKIPSGGWGVEDNLVLC
jgi:hypothetical protein